MKHSAHKLFSLPLLNATAPWKVQAKVVTLLVFHFDKSRLKIEAPSNTLKEKKKKKKKWDKRTGSD